MEHKISQSSTSKSSSQLHKFARKRTTCTTDKDSTKIINEGIPEVDIEKENDKTVNSPAVQNRNTINTK